MISFVYFDVGGVAIKDFSDSDKWEKMYRDLGVKESDLGQLENLYYQHSHEINIDYDYDNFIPILKNELNIDLPSNFSLLDELVSRFTSNPGIWPIVDIVQAKSRIGLLTNMWPRMFSKIVDANILPNYQWVVVDSSVVKLQKPNLDIYQLAQSKAGVPANEILFIDNTKKHLIEPANLGWQTYFYDSSNYEQSNRMLNDYIHQENLFV